MKTCTVCRTEKSKADFYASPRSKDGLFGYCKPCHKARGAELRKLNPQDSVERSRRSYLAHKSDPARLAAKREAQSRYRAAHPDRCVAIAKAQRSDPRKAARAAAKIRRWCRAHPERTREYARKNAPKQIARLKALGIFEERMAVYHANRSALVAKAEGRFTAAEWRALKASWGNRCVYCGQAKKLTADHVHPLSRGGSNWITNILPACGSCNSRKRTSLLSELAPEATIDLTC